LNFKVTAAFDLSRSFGFGVVGKCVYC